MNWNSSAGHVKVLWNHGGIILLSLIIICAIPCMFEKKEEHFGKQTIFFNASFVNEYSYFHDDSGLCLKFWNWSFLNTLTLPVLCPCIVAAIASKSTSNSDPGTPVCLVELTAVLCNDSPDPEKHQNEKIMVF